MPHSRFWATSRTSSRKRRSESILSVAMSLPPRYTRAPPARTMRPSVTKQPAMTVLLPTLKIWRTSARPSTTSTISGSSMPLRARSMSSVSL